jgi:hypothetical protein
VNEIDRILSLPERDLDALDIDLTSNFRRRGGKLSLFTVQSRMLYEAHKSNGLLGMVSVGEGKTLTSFLLPHVITRADGKPVQRPLLLIPASMRAQCIADWDFYSQHFILPPTMFVRSYEELSTKTRMLFDLEPDLIICDEAHKIRNKRAARTKRVARYIKSENPRFVALSGTLTTTSLMDFAHLSKWALGDGSPIPNRYTYLQSWASCLDRDGRPTKGDRMSMSRLQKHYGGDFRECFKSRLVCTPGVVATKSSGPSCSLLIKTKKLTLPDSVSKHLETLKKTWVTPSGEELSSALEYVRTVRQLICGFFYVWKWPGGVVDEDWLEARATWNKAVRKTLERAGDGYDSPALLSNACERILAGSNEKLPRTLLEAYLTWLPHKDKAAPPVAARWFSNQFIEDIVTYAGKETEPPIVWYGHQAVGVRLARLSGWPIFGPGEQASRAILDVTTPEPIIASLSAHSQGKNLQVFGNSIFAHPLSDGARYEQALGRHHRNGQLRDEVFSTVFTHEVFDRAFSQAQRSAKYIEETTSQKQRLLYSSYENPDEKVNQLSFSSTSEQIHLTG